MKKFTAYILAAAITLTAFAAALAACSGPPAAPAGTAAVGASAATGAAAAIPDDQRFVAHACGTVDGFSESNTLDALANSVNLGYTLIEMDFVPTSDGQIVVNHDWEYMGNRVPLAGGVAVTRDGFMAMKIYGRFAPMDLGTLIDFLRAHPGVRVITDTKNVDYTALQLVAADYADCMGSFIPQAYNFEDVAYLRGLGYKDIIVTMYDISTDIKFDPARIAALALQYKVYGITIDDSLVTADSVAALQPDKIRYYVNTVNGPARVRQLFGWGIYGVYTDVLLPTGDGDVCAPQADPYPGQISAIDQSISALPADQQAELKNYLIYKYGSPLNISGGSAGYVTTDAEPADIFDDGGGTPYLPARAAFEFIGGTDIWSAADNSSTFGYTRPDGTAAKYKFIPGADQYTETVNGAGTSVPAAQAFVTYRDSGFISSDIFRSLTGAGVQRQGDYVAVSLNGAADWNSLEQILGEIGF